MAAFGPEPDLIPKLGALTRIFAWMDGVGPSMLVALQP
jgi:hypothetical protein